MNRLTTCTAIFLISFAFGAFAEEKEEDQTFIIKHKGETREVKASENPELKKLHDQIKAKMDAANGELPESDSVSGDTDIEKQISEKEKLEASKPKLEGSKPTADSAYKKDDYETAYEHYKALSAQGDAEASMKLAAMHSRGEGVPKDETTAYAYFARAAEQGDETAKELMGSTRFGDDQVTAIKEQYTKISEEIDDPEKAREAEQNFEQAQAESSDYRGISSPKSIGFDYRTDPEKLKSKTYVQKTTKRYERAPAKSYSRTLARSYEPERISLKKDKTATEETPNQN